MNNLIEGKYIPLQRVFKQKGYILTKVHDFNDGWVVFKREKENNIGYAQYELVKPYKSEEYEIGGNKVAARISYPGTNQFGSIGFNCISLERAKQKHKEITNKKEKDDSDLDIKVPDKEFTIKDLQITNPALSYSDIYNHVKNMETKKEIKVIRKQDNIKGKQSKIYKKI